MPTPFYHIRIAGELLDDTSFPLDYRRFLEENMGIFFFGNTAPDVQVVSRVERQATHFFTLPILASDPLPWERILQVHPSLADPAGLSPDRAAFLAGYLCHLQADWLWIIAIFTPYFGPECDWGSFSQRLYLHNVLRAYLDNRILPTLRSDTAEILEAVQPDRWLPFVRDGHLVEWRDYLAQQLTPGAMTQTVEVFANRQGIAPENFYELLDSEERMEQEVFKHFPRSLLQTYHDQLIDMNLKLLTEYLGGSLDPASRVVTAESIRLQERSQAR